MMSEKQQNVRRRVKTRSGCLRCKQRRIKCDETVPHCNQCTRRAYECPGYKRPLKWSSKYEVAGDDYGQATAANRGNQRRRIFSARARSPQTAQQETQGQPETDLSEIPAARLNPLAPIEHAPSGELHPEGNTSVSTTISEPIFDAFNHEGDGSIEQNQEDSTGFSMQWPYQMMSLESPLEDDDTCISRHYFSEICHINSCFDSHWNQFRVEVGSMMTSRPLIYHCVLSMSAAHLATKRRELSTAALHHRTSAISCLTGEIMKVKEKGAGHGGLSDEDVEALLASILLGTTEGWHSPASLGITHLHGARVLFKRWLSNMPEANNRSSAAVYSSRENSFIVGIMAHWEAVASFLMDQPLDALSHLDGFCDQSGVHSIYPNPWSGICTPVFIYLAKTGTLSRQRSLLRHLSITGSSVHIRAELYANLVAQARETEQAVLHYKLPTQDRIRDPGDVLTPVAHLQQTAQIYRLATLLELYRVFPELISQEPEPLSVYDRLLALATGILTLIQSIPHTSGVNCLFTIPLLIAGSTLQPRHSAPSARSDGSDESSWGRLATELLAMSSHEQTYTHWRGVARERLRAVYHYVGMAAVTHALEILERVWDRADVHAAISTPSNEGTAAEFVQWVEVMMEEKLEALFG